MMASTRREVTRDDILPMEVYEAERRDWRRKLAEVKRDRRVEVGPVATFYFETYLTMWYQIQEMLFIEKGGEAQIPDELAAYNPLVPKGDELVATVMFEIDDPERRQRFLAEAARLRNPIANPRKVRVRMATIPSTVLTALMLVFGLVFGAGHATADSLPGDPLYGIKLMAEEVRMASVPAPAGKAELARTRSLERLDDAVGAAGPRWGRRPHSGARNLG